LHSGTVEGVAVTDDHEVLLTRLRHDLADVEQLGVELVHDDLAAVDATGGVAPLAESVGGVEELLLQAWRGGRARVGRDADMNVSVGDAPGRRTLGATRSADGLERTEVAGTCAGARLRARTRRGRRSAAGLWSLGTRAAAGGHHRHRQQERRGRADHDPARTIPQ